MTESDPNPGKIKQLISKFRGVYFWKRLVIFISWTFFLFAIIYRLVPDLLSLAILTMIILFVWTVLGTFRNPKASNPNKKTMRPIWQRLLVGTLVAPIAFLLAVSAGTGIGLAIKPYSAQEITEKKAIDEAEARAETLRLVAEEKQKAEEAFQAENKAEADRLAEIVREKSEETKRLAEEQRKQQESEADPVEENERNRVEGLRNSNPLKYAEEYCGLLTWGYAAGAREYVVASEDGSTLFLTTKSIDDIAGQMVLFCVADAIEMSDPLKASIARTNALAGTKTWDENNFNFEWSFHPDTGINMSVIRKKDCFLGFC